MANNEKLTLDKLKRMKHREIIATGVGIFPAFDRHRTVRWVATRGGYHDWAMYYHYDNYDENYILRCGNKAFTEKTIRKLVPCDNEAWDMYRL